jgi:hypothetical protein
MGLLDLAGSTGAAFGPWTELQHGDSRRRLINAATLAASAHNTQPWTFEVASDVITLSADGERHIGTFDVFRREMHESLGCALENLDLAARAQGLSAQAELHPGRLEADSLPGGPAATIRLRSGAREPTEGFDAIPKRHTHRGPYEADRVVPQAAMQAMEAAASDMPAKVVLFTGKGMVPLAELICRCTAAIVGDPEMSRDNARWFRFRQRAIEEKRDGLTLDANVPGSFQNFVAKLFPPSRKSADRHWLHDTQHVQLATAPLLGVIAVRDPYDRPTTLAVGRLWQRLHLLLVSRGLAAQPLNQPIEWMDRERQLGKRPQTAKALVEMMPDRSWVPTFVFRAGYARRPAPLSPRRAISDVIAHASGNPG